MTRILVTADHHIGNHGRFGGSARGGINARARLALAATRSAQSLARKLGCSAHLICGDLFHSSRPSPPMLAAVQRAFVPDPRSIVLLGNHDYHSAEPHDHALSPLEPVVELVTEPRIITLDGLEIWAVPFTVCEGRAIACLAELLAELAKTSEHQAPAPLFPGAEQPARALAVHMGIGDAQTSAVLRATAGWAEADELAELAQRYGIRWVFAGDWHEPRVWWDPGKLKMRTTRDSEFLNMSFGREGQCTIVQCGTLCPTGFGDDGFARGKAWLLDTATGIVEPHTVPGPRFVRAASVDALELPDEPMGLVFAEVTTTLAQLPAEKAALAELAQAKVIEAGHVRLDKSEISRDTQRAASRARDAGSIQDAARAWVQAMPLEAGVDRARVSERVAGYLRG